MYNNPFMYQGMYRPGILARLFGRGATTGISFSNILSTTQKSLNVINQVIPLVNQVKPMINNAKTVFKIANILKDDNTTNNKEIKKEEKNINTSKNPNKPIFYI